MKGIIDRFESNFAVVETEGREMKNIAVSVLPEGAKEGDVVVLANGKWRLNIDEAEKFKAKIENLAGDLFE